MAQQIRITEKDGRFYAAMPGDTEWSEISQSDAFRYTTGAGEETSEALARASAQHRQREAYRQAVREEAFGEMNPYEQFFAGAFRSGEENIQGVRQAMGAEGAEERVRELEEMPSTWWSLPGYLGAEIAQVGIPGAAAMRLTRAPIMTDVVMSAIQQGMKGTTDESELAGRGQAAALGGTSAALGGALSRAVGGMVTPTPEAAGMIGRGRRITPGQAGGPLWQSVEQGAEGLPIFGQVIKNQQTKGLLDWNREVLSSVSPYGSVKRPGSPGLQELSKQFEQAYGELRALAPDRIVIDDQGQDALLNIVNSYGPLMGPESRAELLGEVKKLYNQSQKEGLPTDEIKSYIDTLNKLEGSAYRRDLFRLGESFAEVGEVLKRQYEEALPEEFRPRAREVNRAYSRYMPVLIASAKIGPQKQQFFTPDQLINAIRVNDRSLRKKAFAEGRLPLQREAAAASEVFGRTIPTVGPGTAEKILPWLIGGQVVDQLGGDPLMMGTAITAGALAAGLAPFARRPMLGQLPGQAAYRKMPDLPMGVRSQVTEQLMAPYLGQ